MKKLLIVTDLEIKITQPNLLIPVEQIDSHYQVQYNLGSYLYGLLVCTPSASITGKLQKINVSDDNKQAKLIECSQQDQYWDSDQAEYLLSLAASDKTVMIRINNMKYENTLLVVMDDEVYDTFTNIFDTDEQIIEQLSLLYLPIKFDWSESK